MRIVFVGATGFGLSCCEMIINEGHTVVGIITAPKEFRISYSKDKSVVNINHADFSAVSKEYNIPLLEMSGKMAEKGVVDTVRSWSPKLIVVVGWYHMVPKVIRDIAPVAGLHASLLPDYSGGAPLVWAIINGEEKTGISFFMFDDGVDNGPIIGQKEEPIYFEDTIATLYARIEKAGVGLLKEYLPKMEKGDVSLTPQDESKRRVMPQRSPEDGAIDWNWSVRRIYDFVRAQTKPYPGAFTTVNGRKLTIWEARIHDSEVDNGNAGEVLEVLDKSSCCGVVVKAGDVGKALLITRLSITATGNREHCRNALEVVRSGKIKIGEVLGVSD